MEEKSTLICSFVASIENRHSHSIDSFWFFSFKSLRIKQCYLYVAENILIGINSLITDLGK